MEPQNIRFGGGVGQTYLSPIVLVVIVIASVMICVSGRRRALTAFLTAAILIPVDQVLLLGDVHFPMLRMLAFFGLARCLWGRFYKKEPILSGGMNGIDKTVIALSLLSLVTGMLLWQVWAQLVFQLGSLLSAFGAYFLLRSLIKDSDDILHTIRVLAAIAVVVAFIMAYEQFTGVNLLYSTLGGARERLLGSAIVRDGNIRAAGPFAISILAGTFGGILIPLFVGLWWKDKKSRLWVALGLVAAAVIPFATNSSTSLFGFIAGIIGLCFWPMRKKMRMVRWSIVVTLVALHLYMTSPVWHLIEDVDLTGSSSSFHRYNLINQCVQHFSDWVLVGTKSYADWGWDMWDLCNQYVAIADQSGLIPLSAFITTIVLAFKYLGKARRKARDRQQELFIWALGACLFANVVAFLGVSYYDQTIVVWYALLAMISTTAVSVPRVLSENTLRSSKSLTLSIPIEADEEEIKIPSLAFRL